VAGNKGSAAQALLFHDSEPDLASYDIILFNSSGGKDSQTALRATVAAADAAGVADRIVVVHADLGVRVEWPGTKELVHTQAAHYGVPVILCRREKGDLLDEAEHQRKKWPGMTKTTRWCTADHKTAQVYKVMTALVRKHREAGHVGQVRILDTLGIRAEESTDRANEVPYRFEERASNGRRHVDRWYPIYRWTEDEVWADIRASGVPYHRAYDLGMPRLSCAFCIYGSRSSLVLSAQHNPEMAAEYVRVEIATGHRFKQDLSMAEVVADAKRLPPVTHVENWRA